MCSFVSLAVLGLGLSSKNKTLRGLLPFLQSYGQLQVLRTQLHLFPALKSALSGRHFRSNEEVRQAVKNFLRSLGIDFDQNGFLKLISLYFRCINVGGEYVVE
ncbi:hypothetical protein AVEN_217125-1 [Araneus ventricosus]|uniref:Uncharacterized protein n=1 Tax=Araneus ventricosus TaxID=182803 RepID=A0A4Y2E892_ARAVE|nr:hypothetical protein AVEN_217125-1 [Araneus ventricosus]